MSHSKLQLNYAQVLAAIGRFVAKQELSDVCILEFEDGMILTGSKIYDSGEMMNRRTETHVFSTDDLHKMSKGG